MLIVRGQAHLLDDVTALEDLERIRQIFSTLETKETLLRLLDLTGTAQGVQIFIGSQSELFNLAVARRSSRPTAIRNTRWSARSA